LRDPERAPLVKQLFVWYAAGDRSQKEVGRLARQAGLSFRKSGGRLPTPTIYKILRHRIYIPASCLREWRRERCPISPDR
jgi:hypothetical protein